MQKALAFVAIVVLVVCGVLSVGKLQHAVQMPVPTYIKCQVCKAAAKLDGVDTYATGVGLEYYCPNDHLSVVSAHQANHTAALKVAGDAVTK